MNEKVDLDYLNGPLYRLYHFKDVYDEKIFTKDTYLESIRKGYKSDELVSGIIEALKWVIAHPEYDFQSLGYEHLSNQDIYYYLSEFYKRLMLVLEERNQEE